MLPIAPNHIALEGAARADRHRQNIAWLWDGLELNPFAKSNVIVCDGFRSLLPLAADAEGRNPQTYLDCLRHLLITSVLSCMIARVAVLPSPVGATAVLLTLDPLGDY